MWTTSYNGINSGYQHFINLRSHFGSAASFVQNQRLAYKLVDVKYESKGFIIILISMRCAYWFVSDLLLL